jgi:SulP family sulfate permease
VMDRLKRSHFLEKLSGKVWLSQNDAFNALAREADATDRDTHVDAETPRGWI